MSEEALCACDWWSGRVCDMHECGHDWTLRPESDTYVCEMCGAER